MTLSIFERLAGATVAASLVASGALAQPSDSQPACEAFSQSEAVLVGRASPPVKRWLRTDDAPPILLVVTPVVVERTYLGDAIKVVYLTPFSGDRDLVPGQRYVVYGRHYQRPDLFMASLGHGVKELDRAGDDLTFLDSLTPGRRGGMISGTATEQLLRDDGKAGAIVPLTGAAIRIFNAGYSAAAMTDASGSFSASGIPAGEYQLVPELPQDLAVWDATGAIKVTVRDGGCAIATIKTHSDGRVRGVLRGPTGRPLGSATVDLVPIDVLPDKSSGHIAGSGSVSTDADGVFDFRGRLAGRYYLGVSLYEAGTYTRTYYPGTSDPATAVPIVVARGNPSDGLDFAATGVAVKSVLDVTIESEASGVRKVCIVPLEDQVRGWSTYTFEAGAHFRHEIVEGQRYQVHAHLEGTGGRHLESEPLEFTASTETTTVTLRPDAPRDLHQIER